ncbi:MAG: sigma-70 family RNA polymerase sigma factor [Saprospiraceae bacterium]
MILKRKPYTIEALIAACGSNDRRAQEYLYKQYFDTMFHMVHRMTRDDEASLSIINDGFLKIFQKIGQFSNTGSFEGWIRRIVYNTMTDHFRKQKNNIQFLILEENESQGQNSSVEDLYYADLVTLLDKVPPASREVFLLFALEGYTHVEIAEQLHISPNTSKWHVSNARQVLKTLINRSYPDIHYAG